MTCTDARLFLCGSPEDCTIAEVAAVSAHVFNCPDCTAWWKAGIVGVVCSPEERAVGDRVFSKLVQDPEALAVVLNSR